MPRASARLPFRSWSERFRGRTAVPEAPRLTVAQAESLPTAIPGPPSNIGFSLEAKATSAPTTAMVKPKSAGTTVQKDRLSSRTSRYSSNSTSTSSTRCGPVTSWASFDCTEVPSGKIQMLRLDRLKGWSELKITIQPWLVSASAARPIVTHGCNVAWRQSSALLDQVHAHAAIRAALTPEMTPKPLPADAFVSELCRPGRFRGRNLAFVVRPAPLLAGLTVGWLSEIGKGCNALPVRVEAGAPNPRLDGGATPDAPLGRRPCCAMPPRRCPCG